LENDHDDLIFPVMELRAFVEAKSAVDQVANRTMKASDLPDSDMVDAVYEMEFELAHEKIAAAQKTAQDGRGTE
jgi:hypothetical protein